MQKMLLLSFPILALAACAGSPPPSGGAVSDACGASQYQSLVGGPSSAVRGLDVPDSSRHYGGEEQTATNQPSRLNFVHSGTAFESVTDPTSTITRVFCG